MDGKQLLKQLSYNPSEVKSVLKSIDDRIIDISLSTEDSNTADSLDTLRCNIQHYLKTGSRIGV